LPKRLPEDLIARIVAEIAPHPEGVGIDDLHAALADLVSRRTLQRRLALLVEQQRLHTHWAKAARSSTDSPPSRERWR